MSYRCVEEFVCDGCGALTASRYRDKWLAVEVSHRTDDGTDCRGYGGDACSRACLRTVFESSLAKEAGPE